MNYWLIFLTGLTTGGLSCLAMQGGLLTSVIANQKDEEMEGSRRKHKLSQIDALDWMPAGMFLLAKLVAHTLLGFLLGALGSVMSLSLNARLIFQVFTALFMLATAMNLLEVHPIFRYVLIQPPKFARKWIKNTTKSKAMFAPGVLGGMTIFVPCGVTQAMEVLAISSGSPLAGALVMFFFVLGTSPLMGVIGVAMAKLSESWSKWFLKIAAVGLIFMSLYSINGVLTVLDVPYTWQNVVSVIKASGGNSVNSGSMAVRDGKVQKVSINVLSNGYSPNKFTVKAGIPVEITLKSNGVYTCALSFSMRQFGISEYLDPIDEKIIRFTPEKPGNYTYACSMGMYTGVMKVVK